MEAMELRVRVSRMFFEAVLLLLVVVFVSFCLSSYRHSAEEEKAARHITLWIYLATLLLLQQLRWRRRILIGLAGMQWRRSASDPGIGLTWSEVEELFILGPEEFELRGAGKSIRFTPSFGGVGEARERVSRSLGDLRHRLRDRAMREGELHFRMPTLRWKAHALYLAAVLVLTGLTALGLAPVLRQGRNGVPAIVVFLVFGAWIVLKLRRLASGMGTIVTLYRDGVLVRRLDGSRKISWSTVTGTEWNEKGGLDILEQGGKRVSLPPQLANVTLLEGFIDEARSGPSNA